MKFFKYLLPALLLVTQVQGGAEGTGGGNTAVAEFYQVARAVAVNVRYESDTLYGISGADLISFIGKIKVEASKGALYLDGKKVDATNTPKEMLIVLDTKAWEALSTIRKVLLVIHELLGLLKKYDADYKLSTQILGDIQSRSEDWLSSFDLILVMSQSFSKQSVVCKIFDNRKITHEPMAQFMLEPIAGGVGKDYQIGDEYKFSVSLFNTQASIMAYPPCSKKTKCSDEAIGGKVIAYTLFNFVGEFRDISLELPEYNVYCEAK